MDARHSIYLSYTYHLRIIYYSILTTVFTLTYLPYTYHISTICLPYECHTHIYIWILIISVVLEMYTDIILVINNKLLSACSSLIIICLKAHHSRYMCACY